MLNLNKEAQFPLGQSTYSFEHKADRAICCYRSTVLLMMAGGESLNFNKAVSDLVLRGR